jgi:hypothetical protein
LACSLLSSCGTGASSSTAGGGPLALKDVEVGTPLRHGSLTVFPLRHRSPPAGEEFLALEEGIRRGVVKVEEIVSETGDDRARVDRVRIKNESGKRLWLMSGEIVQGGKQDRVIGQDVIVPPGIASLEVPVFCVEQGRWAPGAPGGRDASAAMSFLACRSAASPAVKLAAQNAKEQGEVWREVGESIQSTGSAAPEASVLSDSSYRNAVESEKAKKEVEPAVAALVDSLKRDPRACGLVAHDGEKFFAADYFANPKLFADLAEKLVRSYALHIAAEKPRAGKTAEPQAGEVLAFLASGFAADAKKSEVRLDYNRDENFDNGTVCGSFGYANDGSLLHVNVMRR